MYWPGSGLEIVEFDLLTVGDDVVFGSRSVVITSSTTCSKKITFEAGCMIADRCVVLPGACFSIVVCIFLDLSYILSRVVFICY